MIIPDIKEVVIMTDIHGCFKTFLALEKKVKEQFPNVPLIIAGDNVDRGPNVKDLVQYIIDNNILCVKGNHCQMMLDDVLEHDTPYKGQWFQHQSQETVFSYHHDNKKMKEHAEWMNTLPLYLEFPDCIKIGDDSDHGRKRHLVISHASIGSTWNFRDPSHPKHHFFKDQALWNRDAPEDIQDIYNVFGHTPQYMEPRIKSFYSNIDTGAVFNRIGYGRLTALAFPSMILIQQDNIDSKWKEL